MMNNIQISASLLSVTAVIAIVQPAYAKLPVEQIANIAERITVLLEGQGTEGSGAIIKQDGDLYTILTAYHVVKDTRPQEEAYVTTFDKKRHPLDSRSIRRLGNFDLAIATFRSSNNYQVAKIGDSNRLRTGIDIYVSGFPKATETIPEGEFTFLPGLLISRISESQKEGYQIVYNNNTKSGMSGGSVLNDNGELVGIHGLAEGELVRNSVAPVKTGRNLGIPSTLFVGLLDNLANLPNVTPTLTFPNSVAPVISDRGQPTYSVRVTSQVVDVKPTDWYFTAFQSLVERYRVISTYQDKTFRGREPITRAELVYMLAISFNRIDDLTELAAKRTSCRYVAPKVLGYVAPTDNLDDWYSSAYKKTAEITGNNWTYPDGSFQGNRGVIRGELVVFLNQIADAYNASLSATLSTKTSSSQDFYKLELASFFGKGDLNYLNIIAQITSVSQLSGVRPNDYYFTDLKSLVERYGSYAGDPDGTFRANNVVTKAEFAVALNALLDKLNEIASAGWAECKETPI